MYKRQLQSGQIASVALMDARSIAATAANKGYLTAATEMDVDYSNPRYFFDSKIYENRVFDSKGVADPSVEITPRGILFSRQDGCFGQGQRGVLQSPAGDSTINL